jgi:hypothetical protein
LQGLRRSAEGLHEELRRTDLQVRVSDVQEVLQKMRPTLTALAAAVVGLAAFVPDTVAAANAQRLSGAQIRAKLTGMQVTDEVHYRFVYERDGTLESFAMGVKKVGKWSIQKDELCLELGENDDGCYTVTLRGEHIEMVPSGLGGPLDGIVQPAYRN